MIDVEGVKTYSNRPALDALARLAATTPPHLARWLHTNVSAIAASEDFDLFFTEIAELTRDIQHAVDRPPPNSPYGPCPQLLEADHNTDCQLTHPHLCSIGLHAPRNATEVKCPQCGTTHPTEGLFDKQKDYAGTLSFTVDELEEFLVAMREYIPTSTIQRWASTGQLNPTGWNNKGEPRYLLDDIRQLWDTAMNDQKAGKKGKA